MLNAMDIVLKHMEGTVMHPQTCKTLLRINKIFQQEGDYVAGAIKVCQPLVGYLFGVVEWA
jgi:hypothetical protein